MKKIFLFSMMCLMAQPLFIGCGKENESNGNDNPQPQKHNVELVYGKGSTPWQNVAIDTIYKYNLDPTVDTIFMVPYATNFISTASTSGLQKVVRKLRELHNVNPNKVFGKGDLVLKGSSVENNPEIVRFFADTLRHTVILNNYKKSK